jgi:hypothetical protein
LKEADLSQEYEAEPDRKCAEDLLEEDEMVVDGSAESSE